MAKAFFDVFPALKLEGKRKDLFAQARVERVTATRMKDFIRVYISSERLIQKADVFAVEKEIKKQLFAGCNVTIKIHEKFSLSSQYNQETLLELYKDLSLIHISALLPIKSCDMAKAAVLGSLYVLCPSAC